MSFFNRRQSSNAATPGSPAATPDRRSQGGITDPEWAAVVASTTEELKAWKLMPQDKLVPVDEAEVGFFYSEETYVVVKTYNHARKINFLVFIWVGSERAKKLAADPPAKVAQLMSQLPDRVVLSREIEGHESTTFKRLFKTYGVQSGDSSGVFNADAPQTYRKRLLHFRLNNDKTRIEVREVPITRQSLQPCDVYIFDEGTKMTQWNGKKCDEEERIAARKYITTALTKRKMKSTSEFLDQDDLFDGSELYRKIGNAALPPAVPRTPKNQFVKKMFRLSDESRKLVMNLIYTGKIYRSGINVDDVTIIDTFHVLLIYIGPGASPSERDSVWKQAETYLKTAQTPQKAVTVFSAGCYCQAYEEVWDDAAE